MAAGDRSRGPEQGTCQEGLECLSQQPLLPSWYCALIRIFLIKRSFLGKKKIFILGCIPRRQQTFLRQRFRKFTDPVNSICAEKHPRSDAVLTYPIILRYLYKRLLNYSPNSQVTKFLLITELRTWILLTSLGEQSKKFSVDVVTFLKNMPFFKKKKISWKAIMRLENY